MTQVMVMGAGGVGKTSLCIKFVTGEYVDNEFYVCEILQKDLVIQGNPHSLLIVDHAGQEEYDALRLPYITDSKGFLFLFSLDCMTSLTVVSSLIPYVQKIKNYVFVPIVLVGAKCDSTNRTVSDAAQQLANSFHCKYFEVSAKNNINIEAPFYCLAQEVLQLKPCTIKKANKNK